MRYGPHARMMDRRSVVVVCLVATIAAPAAKPGRPSSIGPERQGRTLWTEAQDGATISRDGRRIAYIDWTSNDVAVRDVATGATRRLTGPGRFAGSVGFPEPYLVFSPSADRVVYPFGNNQTGDPFSYELRLLGIDDAQQQVLATYPPTIELVVPLDWHATAGLLLTTVAGDGSSELLVMHPHDRTVRVLEPRRAGSGVVYRAMFTPDAQAVVYLANGEVFRVATAGGSARRVGIAAETLLGLNASGQRLLFYATRANASGIWSVELRNGGTFGEPSLEVRTSSGAYHAGQTNAGVAYLETAQRSAMFSTTLDIGNAQVLRPPQRVTLPLDGHPGNATWARDGTRLAFTLRHSHHPLQRVMVAQGIGGPVREIARVEMRVMGLDWSHDGRYVVLGGRTDTRPNAWVGRIEVATGRVERLVSAAPVNAVAAGGGESVAYVRAARAGERTVEVMYLERPGTAPRSLATYPVAELPRSMSVSPDGKTVALAKPTDGRRASTLVLLPVDGGAPRTLVRLERPDALELNLGTLPWTSDGTKVLALMRRQGARQLGAIDVESGVVTSLPFTPEEGGRRQPALHPDGRQLVYVDGAERLELKLLVK